MARALTRTIRRAASGTMAFHTVDIPGLPPDVVVRRSTRRRRSVAAVRHAGQTIVTIPNRMSAREARSHALVLHERLMVRTRGALPTDSDLHARALQLRATYLPEAPEPSAVNWSPRQQRRWGSCTPTEGTIRLSDRLRSMPGYVIDYVLVHELAHLIESHHTPAFAALVERYGDSTRAEAFLDGVDFATRQGPSQPMDEPPPENLLPADQETF